MLGKQLQIFLAIGQHVAADALQESLGERHVVVELEERGLRLDHPELGQVPRRVRILRAERRAERVDLAERGRVDLAFELARHGEKRRPLEKILRVVDIALLVPRRLGRIDRRHAKHRAGPFAIAGRDDRRVQVQKSFLLEEVVNRPANAIPHARHRAERIRPRPQVGPLAQLLERMPLLLQRILFRIGPAMHDHFTRVKLSGLLLAARWLHFAVHRHTAAGRKLLDLRLVVRQIRRRRRSGCSPGTTRRSARES